MEQYIILAILIAGLIVAAMLTRWINWYTWGANQAREDAANKRREARQAMKADDKNKSKKTDE
jgi:hypothetical protein